VDGWVDGRTERRTIALWDRAIEETAN
jgi:hypothetical protein